MPPALPNRLIGGCSWLFRCSAVASVGTKALRAAAICVSLIAGS
jgi:hypothetical protein